MSLVSLFLFACIINACFCEMFQFEEVKVEEPEEYYNYECDGVECEEYYDGTMKYCDEYDETYDDDKCKEASYCCDYSTSSTSTTDSPDTDPSENGQKTTCNPSLVHDTMIVVGYDQVFDEEEIGTFFVPMSDDRNTQRFRYKAYKYFYGVYGLEFDPENPDIQQPSNIDNLEVYPLEVNKEIIYQIYAFNDALDRSPFKENKHRIPITNSKLDEAVFAVAVKDGTTASWTNNNEKSPFYGETFTMTEPQFLFYGSYRIIVNDMEMTNEEDDIYFHPQNGYIHPGTPFLIDFVLKSSLYRYGSALGNGFLESIYSTNETNVIAISSKNVITFPAYLGGEYIDDDEICRDLEMMHDDEAYPTTTSSSSEAYSESNLYL